MSTLYITAAGDILVLENMASIKAEPRDDNSYKIIATMPNGEKEVLFIANDSVRVGDVPMGMWARFFLEALAEIMCQATHSNMLLNYTTVVDIAVMKSKQHSELPIWLKDAGDEEENT